MWTRPPRPGSIIAESPLNTAHERSSTPLNAGARIGRVVSSEQSNSGPSTAWDPLKAPVTTGDDGLSCAPVAREPAGRRLRPWLHGPRFEARLVRAPRPQLIMAQMSHRACAWTARAAGSAESIRFRRRLCCVLPGACMPACASDAVQEHHRTPRACTRSRARRARAHGAHCRRRARACTRRRRDPLRTRSPLTKAPDR